MTDKNAYIEARREWNERYGSYIAQARNWRLFSMGMLVITALSVMGNIYQGAQSKIVPYIVQIDKLGEPVLSAPVPESAKNADVKVVKFLIAGFINDTRSVVSDGMVMKRQIQRARAVATPNAWGWLMEFYKTDDKDSATNPLNIAKTSSVTVTVGSVLPLPGGNSWQVEWREDRRDATRGYLESTKYWRAVLGVTIQPPASDEEARINPIGLYVTSINWNELNTK